MAEKLPRRTSSGSPPTSRPRSIPVVFGWAMYTGGPPSAFANWTMVGGFSFVVSLVMAEIAAAFPTAGGIYFWAYRLGGEEWGPFTQLDDGLCVELGGLGVRCPRRVVGATGFLLAALEVRYPGQELLYKGWFGWLLTAVRMGFPTLPNVIRFTTGIISARRAGDEYCCIIGVLFGAWVFFGYGASAHLAEETHEASETLIIILFCIQDFDGIIAATYSNNFAEYLALLWLDSTCATSSCFMSAQRLSANKIPVRAAYLWCGLSIVITLAVIGSSVAFSAIMATAAIATNFSYLIPIAARYTIGSKSFVPAKWNLGRYSHVLGTVAILQTLNYAPVCIGIVTVMSLVGWVLPFGLGGRHCHRE
ncbi:amino acid or gaba permease [Coniochaeta sp. 2T2.1]|nr:amino acid or gaba permease [Coniochaeta sp. 2T2.1]